MKFIIFWIGLVLGGANFIHLMAQPKATIVSADVAICETPVTQVQLKIKFEGQSPFGIIYWIYDVNDQKIGGVQIYRQDDALDGTTDLVDGVWTTDLTVTQDSYIQIERVFDATSEQVPNSNPWEWDRTQGSTDVHGQMNITVNKMPATYAGSDRENCGYSMPLAGEPEDPTRNVYWTSASGGSFNDATNPNAVFTAELAGYYTLTLNEENGACIGKDDVVVWIKGHASSILSGSKVICSNDGSFNQLSTNTNIQGTAPFTYVLNDGVNSLPPVPGIVGDNPLMVPATHEAIYKVVEIIDGNSCTAHIDSLKGQATVTDRKPDADAGLPDKWCETDLNKGYTLSAKLDKGTGEWQVHPQVNFDDVSNPNAIATASSFGTHTLIWEETFEGCSEQSTVEILFVDPPILTVLKADTAICNGSSANLRVSTVSAHYDLDLSYSDGTNSYNVPLTTPYSEISLTPTGVGQTVYQLNSVSDLVGCSSSLTDVFNVSVDHLPTPNAGVYDPECGSSIILNAALGAEETGTWSSIYGSFTDVNDPKTTFSVDESNQLVTQAFDLNWNVVNQNNTNCKAEITTQVILDKRPYNVFAGKDSAVYKKPYEYFIEDATGLNDMVGKWTSEPAGVSFDDTSIENSTATFNEMGSYKLIWMVSNGACIDALAEVDTLKINVKGLTNPTGFSPNGDGINEYFMIGGASKIDNNKLMVFTIEGKLIYEAQNFGKSDETINGWNGVGMDGEKLKNGTYYYVFTEDGKPLVKDFLVIKGNQ